MRLTFVETSLFTATARGVLADEELRAAQHALLADPRAGDVDRGTGGARKLRIALPGRGKRGGARVFYVYVEARATVYLLLAYPKSVAGALSAAGRKRLRAIVEAIQAEEG